MNVTIQPAENRMLLEQCLDIRNAVFTLEKGVPKEIEVDENDCMNGICSHYLVKYKGNNIGTVRCFHVSEDTVRIQRFCFLKEYRKLGFGKNVMKYIEEYYGRRGVRFIEMDAKYEVYGFYEKCGYQRVSDVFMEAGIDHVKMKKSIGDGEPDGRGRLKSDSRSKCKEVERSIVKKFRKEIWRNFTKAINEYELIKDGDKIAVCISGGKDSMLMAKLFQELWRHGRQNFTVTFLVMNPGYNEMNYQTILRNAELLNVPVTIFKTEIFDAVSDITDSPCYLCARMRRGYLYSKAKELGCNKIALGHHFDDVIETILMGMLYGGQVQTMMPKLHSTNFEGMELIRPMYLIREEDIIKWMHYNELTFIQCACRFTENCARGDMEKGSKRAEIKDLIRELRKRSPFIENNIFRSVENVNLSTIIAYKQNGIRHHFLDQYDSQGNEPDGLACGRAADSCVENNEKDG